MKNPDPFAPLTDAELSELDHFWLLRSMLTTIHPKRWLPKVWGLGTFMPSMESINRLNQVMSLIMRHYNSIIAGLESEEPEMTAVWAIQEYRGKTYDQARRSESTEVFIGLSFNLFRQ